MTQPCPPDPAPPATLRVKSALAVSLTAGPDAVGARTLAQVTAVVHVVNRGLFSYATGAATALAVPDHRDAGGAYASTYLSAEMSGGTMLSWDEAATADGQAAHANALSFTAIDLSGLAAAGIGLDGLQGSNRYRCDPPPACDFQISVALSGNLALFDVHLSASGDNGLVDLATDALALEGQLSSVAISAVVAVSDTLDFQVIGGGRSADRIETADDSTIVFGEGGRDEITAGRGNDWLLAGQGDDVVFGGDGDDTLAPGLGVNVLDGGAGYDTADFSAGGAVLGNTLVSIERIIGSALGDLLVGDGADNSFVGGAGPDTIIGQGGLDTADYSASAAAVNVRLNTTVADPFAVGCNWSSA